jgi:cyanophycinase
MPIAKPHDLLRRALTLGLLLPLLASAAQDPSIDIRQRGQGWAFVIGGGLKSDNEVVWKRLVALAGGPGARFVVLGTASNNPTAAADQAADQLRRYGAVAETLPVSPLLKEPAIAAAVRDAQLVARVRAAKGVFMTGGSQDRIVDNLYPGGRATPLLQAIWDVYRSGGVVAGTSAGAAIMSATMFRDAPDVLKVMKGRWAEGEEVGPGLGFVGPDLFVDQHFLKRGRLGRMLPLMAAKGYRIGLGVEETVPPPCTATRWRWWVARRCSLT